MVVLAVEAGLVVAVVLVAVLVVGSAVVVAAVVVAAGEEDKEDMEDKQEGEHEEEVVGVGVEAAAMVRAMVVVVVLAAAAVSESFASRRRGRWKHRGMRWLGSSTTWLQRHHHRLRRSQRTICDGCSTRCRIRDDWNKTNVGLLTILLPVVSRYSQQLLRCLVLTVRDWETRCKHSTSPRVRRRGNALTYVRTRLWGLRRQKRGGATCVHRIHDDPLTDPAKPSSAALV